MDRGAHFYKTDFQVHTPRDINWKGAGATSDDERIAYATEFVAACRARDLTAVAITDHHDVAFFPNIKRAAAEETDESGETLVPERRLVVFPGIELTLGVPCQALLLLDADFPEDLLPTVLTALAATNDAPASAAKHGSIVRLDHLKTLGDLYARLNQQQHLKGRFIVLPNVGESGDFSLIRKGFTSQYKEMPCVGGYVDGAVTRIGTGTASILDGRAKEWGNRALGVFQTSDNRERSFKNLGSAHTWVKWARPTAEALRQACLARNSRISQVQPTLPAIRITRVEVSNSKFLGPFTIDLNPQYNAFIGGRGTGKSSILEYLRWALADHAPVSEDDLPDYQSRRTSLIAKTLQTVDANVQVTVMVNDTEHVVRRHADGRVLLKIGSGELLAATEGDVRSLLPVQAYSQKQLSSVGIKADELRRFVNLPIQPELDALRSRLDDAATRMRAAHDALREHRRLNKENAAAKTELGSVEQQLTALRQSLKGVTDADRLVISSQPKWAQEQRIVERWRKEVSQIAADIRTLQSRVQTLPSARGDVPVNDGVRLDEMAALLRQMFNESEQALAEAGAAILGESATRQDLKAAASAWDHAFEENRRKYDDAKSRAAESETALKQIADLEQRHRELVEAVAGRERRLVELGDPEQWYAEREREWGSLHNERTKVLESQCRKLSDLSKGLLRATVRRAAGATHVSAALKELVKGSKMRTDRLDQLVENVIAEQDPVSGWLEVVRELRALSEMDPPASAPIPPCPRIGSAQLTEGDRRKLAERLAPRGWADFAVQELEDVPRFEYRAREGEYIEFADASAGQQATALMFVLLNQDGPPLVIDQPEDDLDNHVVGDIVEQVWLAKSKRQLIFASHNANLVVNGDAELVVGCGYRTAGDQSGGTIRVQGAIDVDEVRTEIWTVMEGGRAAFTLRKEKYGF